MCDSADVVAQCLCICWPEDKEDVIKFPLFCVNTFLVAFFCLLADSAALLLIWERERWK